MAPGIGLAWTNAILVVIILTTAMPSAAFLYHPRFQQGKKELLGLSYRHRHLLPCGFSPSRGGEEREKGGMWVMEASKPSAEQNSLAVWQRGMAAYIHRRQSDEARAIAASTLAQDIVWRRAETLDGHLVTGEGINNCLSGFSDSAPGEIRRRAEEDAIVVKSAIQAFGFTAGAVDQRLAGGRLGRCPGPLYLKPNINGRRKGVSDSEPEAESSPDGLGALIKVFLLGMSLTRNSLANALGDECVAAMERLGLIGPTAAQGASGGGTQVTLVSPHVQLFPLDANARSGGPARDFLFATDLRPPTSVSLREEPVMYIGTDSVGLVVHSPKEPACERLLDICCGSGIQGIVAAGTYAEHVTCVDLNPRAIRFTRFNAVMNGLEGRVNVLLGDLFDPVIGGDAAFGGRWDAILANPPFIPVPPTLRSKRYDLFADGGNDGEDVLRRVVSDGMRLLGRGGRMCIVTELCGLEGYGQKVAGWVGEEELEGGCAGVVVYDFPIPTASDYCKRRGGSLEEEEEWRRNLEVYNISTVANGFIFLRRGGGHELGADLPGGGEVSMIASTAKAWAVMDGGAAANISLGACKDLLSLG